MSEGGATISVVSESGKYAALDLETRCNVELAREVLHLDASVEASEVWRRLTEKRRETSGSDFLKLPFHEPIAAALLLSERQGEGPEAPIVATDWRCWRAGELPMEQFVARFFKNLAGRTYIGFNSHAFDLPLMELWASRCRVAAPEHFDQPVRPESPRYKYASDLHLDLQKELVNWAYGSGTFDELCKFHGLPGKPGVGGEDVEGMVAQGRLEEIHAYNVTDVLQTQLLFLHIAVRSGRLTREAAAVSARSALALTQEKVAARMAGESPARALLERTIEACGRAPIAIG